MSHHFPGQLDPEWERRRAEIAAMPRDVLEAALFHCELDAQLATVMGRDVQKQLDAARRQIEELKGGAR